MFDLVEIDQYIAPDGAVYTFRDDQRRFLMSVGGEGLPPIEYITQRGPQQHGETLIDFRLRPRTIQMVYREQFACRGDYWDGRGGARMTDPYGDRRDLAGLLDALRPNRQASVGAMERGRLRKILPGGQIRDLYVVLAEGPAYQPRDPQRWDEWAYTETLRFVAHDPLWYDGVTTVCTYDADEIGGLSFPATVPLTFGGASWSTAGTSYNLGTWAVYPQITVQGPCTEAIIENETTGETLDLVYTLLAGESVVIDLTPGAKSAYKEPGHVNVLPYLAGSSISDLATWHLEPHPTAALGANGIACTMIAEGTGGLITLSYRAAYLGI